MKIMEISKKMINNEGNKRFQNELFKCTRCGKCTYYCPTFSVMKWDTYSPRGRLLLIDNYINDEKPTQNFVDRIYSCSICKLCKEICPSHVDIQSLIELTRNKLVNQGKAPYSGHLEMIDNIMKSGNIFNKHNMQENLRSLIDELPECADTILYVGCTGSHQYTELAINWIELLKRTGTDFSVLKEEYCCGGFLKTIGETNKFREIALKNIAVFKKLGIKNIITACPMCYSTLKNDYPDIMGEEFYPFNVFHIYEIIDKAIQNKKIMLFRDIPIKVSYHDPCHLGRWSGLYDIPRNILKSIPKLELIEMDKVKKEALCCGGPINVPFIKIRSDMSEKIIDNADKIGADALVTACPTCYHNLRVAGLVTDIQVYELSEFIAYSVGILNNLEGEGFD